MSTTIQINSLQALERLIGNDNNVEIQLRNSIVQEFVKKHLKHIANDDLITNTKKAVTSEITAQFFDEIKTNSFWNNKIVFKPGILDEVKKELQIKAREELSELISQIVEEQKVYDTIKEKLNSTTTWIVEQLASERLEARLERMVDQRLKEKLGLK